MSNTLQVETKTFHFRNRVDEGFPNPGELGALADHELPVIEAALNAPKLVELLFSAIDKPALEGAPKRDFPAAADPKPPPNELETPAPAPAPVLAPAPNPKVVGEAAAANTGLVEPAPNAVGVPKTGLPLALPNPETVAGVALAPNGVEPKAGDGTPAAPKGFAGT